jgi:hypothetical protein
MAVRNSRPRTQTNYIFVKHNNQRFMLQTGAFQVKAIVYSTKKKLLAGKIEIPVIENPKNLDTILITCSKSNEGGLKFDMI